MMRLAARIHHSALQASRVKGFANAAAWMVSAFETDLDVVATATRAKRIRHGSCVQQLSGTPNGMALFGFETFQCTEESRVADGWFMVGNDAA